MLSAPKPSIDLLSEWLMHCNTDFPQKETDVSGAANPYLADLEKSKKGEGVKASAKIEVGHPLNDSPGWCFISFQASWSQSDVVTSVLFPSTITDHNTIRAL